MLALKLFIALICSIIIIIIINTDAADEEVLVSTISTPKHCSSSDSSSSKMIAKTGDTVGVHYTGSIDETSRTGDRGKVFDSSLKKKPLRFELGSSPVIKGWHIGINGMCLGEKRIIQIPPKYGYGNAGAGKDIPGGATLSFEVELVSINDESITPNKAPVPNIFDEMDTDRDFKISYDEMEFWFQNKHPSQQRQRVPHNLFETEDKDQDRSVSWEEFKGPKGTVDYLNSRMAELGFTQQESEL